MCWWCHNNINWLLVPPILTAVLMIYMPLSCYLQGLLATGHFNPFLPMVSDTGNLSPEANCFTFYVALIGILFLCVAVTRFLQLKAIISDGDIFAVMVEKFYQKIAQKQSAEDEEEMSTLNPQAIVPGRFAGEPPRRAKGAAPTADYPAYQQCFNTANFISLICGIWIAISFITTGAYRYAETFSTHNLTASGMFAVMPVYMAIQVYFTAVFAGPVNTRQLFRLRRNIFLFSISFVSIFILLMAVIVFTETDRMANPAARLFWNTSEPKGFIYLILVLTEWAYLLSLAPFVYLFVHDFCRISFHGLMLRYAFLQDIPLPNTVNANPQQQQPQQQRPGPSQDKSTSGSNNV